MSTNLHLAAAEDLTPAVNSLTSAFKDYPWARWVIPEEGYGCWLRSRLRKPYLGHIHRYGTIMTTESLCGVIALLPPDTPEPGAEIVELQ